MTRVTDPDLVSMLFRTIAERDEMRATTCLDGREAADEDDGGAGDLPADSRYEAAVTEHIRKRGERGERAAAASGEEDETRLRLRSTPRPDWGKRRDERRYREQVCELRLSLLPGIPIGSPYRTSSLPPGLPSYSSSTDLKTASSSPFVERENGDRPDLWTGLDPKYFLPFFLPSSHSRFVDLVNFPLI